MRTSVPRLVGVPYEEGAFWRKGMKEGPHAIFSNLAKLRTYSVHAQKSLPWSWNEILGEIMDFTPYDKGRCLSQIEEKVMNLLSEGNIPFLVGGDHSITLPAIRALTKFLDGREFAILYFDAHSDTFAPVEGYAYHHGAVIRNVIEENLVKPENIYQFGIRGQVRDDSVEFLDRHPIHCISMNEFKACQCSLEFFNLPKDKLYYVSFDIDVVDPAFAPGTGVPVPGGLTSYEALQLIEKLKNYQVIGLDLVELAPIYDTSGITGLLSAQIIFDLLLYGNFVSTCLEVR